MRSKLLKTTIQSRVCASIKKANQRLVKVLVPGIKRTKQAGGNQFEQMMNMFNMAQQQQPQANGRYSNESPNNFGTAGKRSIR